MIAPVIDHNRVAAFGLVQADGTTPLTVTDVTQGEQAPTSDRFHQIWDNFRARHTSGLVRASGGMTALANILSGNSYIRGLIEQRVDGVMAQEIEIRPAGEDPTSKDVEIAEFVSWNLDNVAGTFQDDLRGILSCLAYGYSIAEMVFDTVTDTPFGRKVCLLAIRDKPQQQYGFTVDEFLNVTAVAPWSTFQLGQAASKGFDPRMFVVAGYRREGENPFGFGLLEQLFWIDQFMRDTVAFHLNYMERFGQPFITTKLPPGAPTADYAKAAEFMSGLQSRTYAAMDSRWDVSIIEASHGSTGDYESMETWTKEQCQIAILGQTLTSGEGQHGTQALGVVHEGVMSNKTESDMELVLEVVNEQIIRLLVDLNYPSVMAYPTAHTVDVEPSDMEDKLRALSLAVGLGMDVEATYAHKYTGIPVASEGADLLTKPASPAPSFPPSGQGGDARADMAQFAAHEYAIVKRPFWRKLTRFEHRPVLEDLVSDTDAELEIASELGAEVMTKAQEAVIKAVRKDTGKGNDISDDVQRLDLDAVVKSARRELEEVFTRAIVKADMRGQRDVVRDIAETVDVDTASFSTRTERFIARFAKHNTLPPPQEAIDDLRTRTPLTKTQLSKMKKSARSRAFYLAGIESRDLVGEAQNLLIQAVENGRNAEWFAESFRVAAEPWTGGVVAATAVTPHRLSTVFRTNMMTAYNRGRREVMEDSSLADFVTHYFYSAVLDDRTREDHAAMDQQIYPKNDPIWGTWYPPNGYNCRCSIMPITEADPVSKDEVSTAAPVVDGRTATPDKGFGST